ncbi:MAG TPA: penicillin acylase family protein [Terriglobales bacterium]
MSNKNSACILSAISVPGIIVNHQPETYNLLSFMNSYTFSGTASVRVRSKGWRLLGLWALGTAVILTALLAWFMTIARSALPELDGSVSVPGLSAPVSVTRNAQGVPMIEAANLSDLFFAQGYVTAQDRLFQMDLMRRAAAGELSEIVGEVALEHDRQQRILGIRAAADKGLAATTPEDRQQFEAYARGVNAFISWHQERLPLEFRLLRYAPRPWRVEDSLMIAYQMVETLSTSPSDALTRQKVLDKLGPELTADLYVNTSWRDHPPGAAPKPETNAPAADYSPPTAVTSAPSPRMTDALWQPWLQPFFRDGNFPIGSNNWVISGGHTVSGKPLLSNDMHLGHQMPNLWYEAHLRSGAFDVAGVTLPGYPYVIVGHNQRVAWGFTNVGPTVEDAYIEKFNGNGQYLTPEGWKQPEMRHEVIKVKGKPDVALDVSVTRHGPIFSELDPRETRKIALRWTLYDGIRSPFFHINMSLNWQEFRRAFSELDAPGQNVVYADVDGNIGYQATGKIPIRAAGDGSIPVEGSDNAHEWIGYVPFEKLPSVLNPASGIIGTANSRITPDGYPYPLSVEWEAPWRTDRIYRVLRSGKNFSAADMLSLQTDVHSELDRFIADKMVYAIDHARNPTPQARKVADILRQWNGQMDANSTAPTIASETRNEIKRLLLEPKLGSAVAGGDSQLSWKSYEWMQETVWLENVLTNQPARWLPSSFSDYNELIAAATEQALKSAPSDLNSWQWGKQNALTIQNPILGRVPILRRWSGTGTNPQSGSVYTVKAVGHAHGPSERFTADLSNWDTSTLNTVTGQSGNFLSPYYLDQWQAWYTGYTFALPFSKTAVVNTAAHRLMLEPK